MTRPGPPTTAFRSFDQELSSTPVDDSTFIDDWINTSDSPQGWQSLRTTFLDGVPVIYARLADGTGVEFSEITLYGGISSPDLTAFSAARGDADSRVLLQGNLNLGLLVLATFKIPAAGGIGYFSREFFARSRLSSAIAPPATGNSGALFEQLTQPDSVGLEALLGRWCNADFQTRGLLEVTVEKRGIGVTARALGTPLSSRDAPVDWGIADVGIFACLDEAGRPSLSALARWDFDLLNTHLQLRVPGGTLAVAGFNGFRDGRMNYATREFFYRSPFSIDNTTDMLSSTRTGSRFGSWLRK